MFFLCDLNSLFFIFKETAEWDPCLFYMAFFTDFCCSSRSWMIFLKENATPLLYLLLRNPSIQIFTGVLNFKLQIRICFPLFQNLYILLKIICWYSCWNSYFPHLWYQKLVHCSPYSSSWTLFMQHKNQYSGKLGFAWPGASPLLQRVLSWLSGWGDPCQTILHIPLIAAYAYGWNMSVFNQTYIYVSVALAYFDFIAEYIHYMKFYFWKLSV